MAVGGHSTNYLALADCVRLLPALNRVSTYLKKWLLDEGNETVTNCNASRMTFVCVGTKKRAHPTLESMMTTTTSDHQTVRHFREVLFCPLQLVPLAEGVYAIL